jgi:hypothetical protein
MILESRKEKIGNESSRTGFNINSFLQQKQLKKISEL